MKHISLILIAVLLLSGCLAPKTRTIKVDEKHVEEERKRQQELALNSQQQMMIRLFGTAYPLRQAASAFCEDNQTLMPGFMTGSEFYYQEAFRDTAKKLFGMDEHLRITHIIENSPAADAGLQLKDRITAVNGQMLPEGKNAREKFHGILQQAKHTQINIKLERRDETIEKVISLPKGCNYAVALSSSDAVNAYADGSKVVITRGMMRFAQSEQELALVVSHEIAHNAMSHITAKTLNSLGGTLLDIAAAVAGVNTQGIFGTIGARAYSQAFENEADYVGLYIMARAGMQTDGAAMFWRKMAVEHPGSINSNHASTHPATAERFIAIEETIDQIEAKKLGSQTLLPDMKK
ncbi:MAG: M48 family metalloprotease [Gammaproteobacteria bacterium]|nr:M48 family metalloprotease [Gammaproteobacteria bacterium]